MSVEDEKVDGGRDSRPAYRVIEEAEGYVHNRIVTMCRVAKFWPTDRPAQVRVAWPEMEADWMAYASETERGPRWTPSARDVGEAERMMELIATLKDVRLRRTVWYVGMACALPGGRERHRMPWTKVGRQMGVHASTVQRRYEEAVRRLVARV